MKEYSSDIEFDNQVMYILNQHKGKDNRIARWDFVRQMFGDEAATEPQRNNNNVWDRKVRESVERWRSQGQHICNLGDGYFMACTREEYEEFKEYYIGAALRKLEIVKMMDETAKHRWTMMPRNANTLQPNFFGGMS